MAFTSYDNPDEFFGSSDYTHIANGASATTAGPCIVLKSSGATVGSNLLSTLTDTEAADSTGDTREVVFSICEAIFTKFNALASADRPNKMTVSRTTSEDSSANEFVRTYSIQLRLSPPDFDVAAES